MSALGEMPAMNWRWISLTALLAALVIGYGALNKRDAASALIAEPPARPGYYLRHAIITQTDPDGSLSTRLAAARIELQPADDNLSMTDVQVDYFQSKEQEWRLTADRGFRPGNSPIIELAGNVELRPARGGTEDRLQTEQLAIDTQKEVAYSTSSPVQISYGPHTMDVESFRFDMDRERLHMQAIQGHYERS